ncbi:hypothetical protein KY284_012946 [Solanum tuberosum]|nr:hypothetical protein KY284_012946 [Solanum tuberosum]
MVAHITETIKPNRNEDYIDKAWWLGNTKGCFIVSLSFNSVRRRNEELEWVKNIWIKGLLFKIAFFHWRRRIETDDNLKRMRIPVVSKCYCCEQGEMETMTHLFLTASIAQKLWKQFASCAGIKIEGLHIQQLIIKWWEHKSSNKLEQVIKEVPTILMWELWKKRRNARRHGNEYSNNWMIHQCQMTIHQIIRAKFPWIKEVPYKWEGMVALLHTYKPTLYYHVVNWKPPELGWIKCNTDEVSKGNPGQSSYGFCIRNYIGELLYAEAQDIGVTTNMDAESMAIWRALHYCFKSRISTNESGNCHDPGAPPSRNRRTRPRRGLIQAS